ncbi:N,N-dimethylformamidase beta subunit family domain-containing protein [Myxococcus sp. RHSTA-1-4]|uniref:N,N-dimethylformamidase beta subunit family domain-containing protein n=1 Tax=Myxococcus sp. RHSTA-1-4 TaxID=2874601 RepID=UPI002101EA57|nr:N,N-dimethylformamidase beta subunit family domain-containing protein [Myxococcus sp. RHSTA-1-4]MBZ4422518.1 hemolysin [Myxococcus sp. RHSTA-1-4]
MARGSRWGMVACGLALLFAWGGCEESSPERPDMGDRHDTPPLNDGHDGGFHPGIVDGGTDGGEGGPGTGPGEPDAGPGQPARDADAVRRENQRPGTTAWRINRDVGDRVANNREVEGYALEATVKQGGTLRLAVSVSEAKTFRWFVYRLGYYGGAGGREVARGGPVKGVKQAACPADPATGVVACAWAPVVEIPVEDDWVRGVYVVKLVREDRYQRYVPFFVRDANPRAEVAVLIPTATWAAYNTWGGTSLYDDKDGVMKPHGVGRAFQSSYDRPYHRGQGTGHLLEDDLSLVQWVEAQGLDVGYFTDEDFDASYDFVAGAKALFVSGHDEYWSTRNRDHADRAVAEGRSLLNLGANNAYWHVRMDPAADGRPRRIVTCYKGHANDPHKDSRRTVKFREGPVGRPENALFGVQFSSRWHQFGFPMVITHPAHWALAGTGLKSGDTLWRANGYELDQLVDNGRTPPGVDVLAESPGLSLQGAFGFGHMVLRKQGSAYVFSAGGVDFVRTLASEDMADPRAARIVANILYKALGRPVPEGLVEFQRKGVAHAQGPFSPDVRTVAGRPGQRPRAGATVAADALGAPVAVAVLPDGGWAVADAQANAVKKVSPGGAVRTVLTRLNGPMGIAADAAGNVYVADTDAHVIRRISGDGTAEVFAGTAPGMRDGLARDAAFNQPAGLTLTPDGTALLVADMNNGVIRRIDLVAPGNPVTTLQGDWMYRPSAVAVSADGGTLFVVETGMTRVLRIRDGVTSVVAGTHIPGFQDGRPEAALFLPYLGLAVLKDGSLAVSDPGNYRVRRILFDDSGHPKWVTTMAGSGRHGHRDGPGEDADLVLPAGLAVGPDGRLYVADSGNGLVRAITPCGQR